MSQELLEHPEKISNELLKNPESFLGKIKQNKKSYKYVLGLFIKFILSVNQSIEPLGYFIFSNTPCKLIY